MYCCLCSRSGLDNTLINTVLVISEALLDLDWKPVHRQVTGHVVKTDERLLVS